MYLGSVAYTNAKNRDDIILYNGKDNSILIQINTFSFIKRKIKNNDEPSMLLDSCIVEENKMKLIFITRFYKIDEKYFISLWLKNNKFYSRICIDLKTKNVYIDFTFNSAYALEYNNSILANYSVSTDLKEALCS